MYSSDSEDDCYGNVAQKLQKMKNNYHEDKIETSNLLNDSSELDELVKKAKLTTKKISKKKKVAENIATSHSENSDIENNTESAKKLTGRFTKSSSRKSRFDDVPATPPQRKRARKSKSSQIPANSTNETVDNTNAHQNSTSRLQNSSSRGQNSRSRGQNSSARGQNNSSRSQNSNSRGQNNRSRGQNSSSIGRNSNSRGRNTSRRGRGHSWARARPSPGRGQRRRAVSQAVCNNIPIYSIGNTDEYYDQSDNQALFSNKPTTNDVTLVDENDMSFDLNEELSVKVYWQNLEFFKFVIRRFQKLAQIFDFFSKKKNVSTDKLLLTYNDKILKPEDTPDSINYSIVKFIEAGIVKESVNKLIQTITDIKDGITLKFQCQNMKKPLELTVDLDDKLSIVMIKCAEHLEKPLEKLIFEFDGDSISGKNTARELDLEGGECIDIKMIS